MAPPFTPRYAEHSMRAAEPRTLAQDTTADAEQVLVELYRRLTPEQKLHAIFELQRAGDALALAGIRSRHPGISDREAALRLAARKYPEALMVAAFGWDPQARGY